MNFFFITKNIKNEKIGNAPDKDLAYGWAVKGAVRKPDYIIPLRSTPRRMGLSKYEVKKMLSDNDFYCRGYGNVREYSNPDGKGFENDFVLLKDGQVVYDRNSGLMWQQSGSSKMMTFEEAKTWIKQLNLAGHNDWRLPTLEEAMSLVEPKSSKYQSSKFGYFINPIFANKPCEIWTADQMKGGSGAWIVHFLLGVCYYSDSDFITASAVRAVRSAQSSKD